MNPVRVQEHEHTLHVTDSNCREYIDINHQDIDI